MADPAGPGPRSKIRQDPPQLVRIDAKIAVRSFKRCSIVRHAELEVLPLTDKGGIMAVCESSEISKDRKANQERR